jgi:hypothetical protein
MAAHLVAQRADSTVDMRVLTMADLNCFDGTESWVCHWAVWKAANWAALADRKTADLMLRDDGYKLGCIVGRQTRVH